MNFSGENTFDQIRSKLMPHLTDDEWRTAKIFNMHLFEKIENIFKNNIRFVHYTSAEVALSIISNKKIWLRNSTCMNDYSEVHHGVKAIIDFFKPEGNAGDFWKSLDNISFELSNEIKNLFDSRIHDLTTSTYLTCLSEHDKEEQTGRLSMWRGYGRNSGVAIVVNQNALMANTDYFQVYSYPVHYFTPEKMKFEFNRIIKKIESEIDFLKTMDVETVKYHISQMLQSFTFCLKHHGFKEEREWRIVYRPNERVSKWVVPKLESIKGIPQKIYQLPLTNVSDKGSKSAGMNDLINSVIIGPTEHKVAIKQAFKEALEYVGVENAHEKIIFSDIPIRT